MFCLKKKQGVSDRHTYGPPARDLFTEKNLGKKKSCYVNLDGHMTEANLINLK